MGKGYLIVTTATASESLPVAWANVVVTDEFNNTLFNVTTNESGVSPRMALSAPDKWHSLDPNDTTVPYSRYNIGISADGFKTFIIEGVRILDTSDTLQHVEMIPIAPDITRAESVVHIENGQHNLINPQERFTFEPPPPITGRVLPNVVIPEYITVHLARPETAAPNRRVLFKDYVKNVASHEIFDTWPTAALEANIYCIISFTLNRIYTEFYRSRGYSFDITNSTSIDHFFKPDGAIGMNISRVVDDIFNRYLAQVGHKEPFLAQYCDGRQVKCPGWLTQWGSCTDALAGMTSAQIIKKHYAYDLEFREANLFSGPIESYPGYALREGMSGDIVRTLQNQLNRIGGSFPLPVINPADGIFGSATMAAVVKFQQTFALTPDGIVGKATWYKIQQIYAGVKKLNEMISEGERIGIGHIPPKSTLREGSRGSDVAQLQFLLNFISLYNSDVPSVIESSVFGAETKRAVIAFQESYGLTADGVVGGLTWFKLYDVYWGIVNNVPLPPTEPGGPTPPGEIPPYPDYLLRVGSSGQDVMLVQTALARLAEVYPRDIPAITPDGQFGSRTEAAVIAFQRFAGLSADGVVGPTTWRRLMEEYYDNLIGGPGGVTPSTPPYPGSPLRRGSTGDNVRLIQNYLNTIRKMYPQIPALSADGIFGSGTETAVRTFQSISGLSADGVIGPATWEAIMRAYTQANSRSVESAGLSRQLPGINTEFLIRMMLMRRFRRF